MKRGPDLVRVATSRQSAAADSAAIAAGIPSRALMNRAGAAAAGEIARRFAAHMARGVVVLAGPGNNGGDAWVIARALSAAGHRVRVVEPVAATSPDCIAERALTLPHVECRPFDGPDSVHQGEGVVIDGLLGTGASGALRGAISACADGLAPARERRAAIVAIDLPTGLDATTGEWHGTQPADLTITFGTVKRGQLIARGACGEIVVVDIGLLAGDARAAGLLDDRWFRAALPPIDVTAHKGTRKKLAIIGGDRGMAGAVILAARSAHRSGIGMVRVIVHGDSLGAVQEAAPAALASTWAATSDSLQDTIISWADAVVIGPGLGHSEQALSLLSMVLAAWRGPTLLDADALNAFAGEPDRLAAAIRSQRPRMSTAILAQRTLITPHPAELARLMGTTVDDVLQARFEIGTDVARRCGATVLLKGVPTIITDGVRAPLVSAAGTPALATAGSGDVLSGIAGTMMAQLGDAMAAAGVAALAHGHAAERATVGRGTNLDDIIEALPSVWSSRRPSAPYPVIAELPRGSR